MAHHWPWLAVLVLSASGLAADRLEVPVRRALRAAAGWGGVVRVPGVRADAARSAAPRACADGLGGRPVAARPSRARSREGHR